MSAQSSVLIFLKSLAAPIVLFADNPNQLYDEMKLLLRSVQPASPKLVEKPGAGPLKKVCFWDTEVAGVALQSEIPMPRTGGSL